MWRGGGTCERWNLVEVHWGCCPKRNEHSFGGPQLVSMLEGSCKGASPASLHTHVSWITMWSLLLTNAPIIWYHLLWCDSPQGPSAEVKQMGPLNLGVSDSKTVSWKTLTFIITQSPMFCYRIRKQTHTSMDLFDSHVHPYSHYIILPVHAKFLYLANCAVCGLRKRSGFAVRNRGMSDLLVVQYVTQALIPLLWY